MAMPHRVTHHGRHERASPWVPGATVTLTADESRALAFIAGLLFLSAAVRLASLPERIAIPGERMDLEAHIAATERAVSEAERMARPLAPDERLDPNTAPAVELARLPRVGPALARRIVEDREQNGPFLRTGDLTRVPGVGPRLVDLAAPHLTLTPGPLTPAPGVAGERGPARVRPGNEVVDLNTADAAALEALPGVGPVLAERIVAYRDSVGRLTSPEDLLSVRGIGEATLERIRPRIRAGP
jgi:competence ComEA-like helix-hairpin-helix protein